MRGYDEITNAQGNGNIRRLWRRKEEEGRILSTTTKVAREGGLGVSQIACGGECKHETNMKGKGPLLYQTRKGYNLGRESQTKGGTREKDHTILVLTDNQFRKTTSWARWRGNNRQKTN